MEYINDPFLNEYDNKLSYNWYKLKL
jgi:hypothetical protein